MKENKMTEKTKYDMTSYIGGKVKKEDLVSKTFREYDTYSDKNEALGKEFYDFDMDVTKTNYTWDDIYMLAGTFGSDFDKVEKLYKLGGYIFHEMEVLQQKVKELEAELPSQMMGGSK